MALSSTFMNFDVAVIKINSFAIIIGCLFILHLFTIGVSSVNITCMI